MRLITRAPVALEFDPDSYGVMMAELKEMVQIQITHAIDQAFTEAIVDRLRERIDMNDLGSIVSRYMDISNVADYVRRGVVGELIGDERFNTRIMRHIGDATIGVTNEAVERITAIIKAQTTTSGDF
jgi:hypothetical protein